MAMSYSSRYSSDSDLSPVPELPVRRRSFRDDDDDESSVYSSALMRQDAAARAQDAYRQRLMAADIRLANNVAASDDPHVNAVASYGAIVGDIRNNIAAGMANLPEALKLYNKLTDARDNGAETLNGIVAVKSLGTPNAERLSTSALAISKSEFNREKVMLPNGIEMTLGDMFSDGTLSWSKDYMSTFIGSDRALNILCDGADKYKVGETEYDVTGKLKDTLVKMSKVVPGTAPGDFTGGDLSGTSRSDKRALVPFVTGNFEYVLDKWHDLSGDLGEDAASELVSFASKRCVSGGFSNYVGTLAPMLKHRLDQRKLTGDKNIDPVREVHSLIGVIDHMSKYAKELYTPTGGTSQSAKDVKNDDVYSVVSMFSRNPDADLDSPAVRSVATKIMELTARARSQGWGLIESMISAYGSAEEASKKFGELIATAQYDMPVSSDNILKTYEELVSGNEFLVRGSPTKQEMASYQGEKPPSGGRFRKPLDAYYFPAAQEMAQDIHAAIEMTVTPWAIFKGTPDAIKALAKDDNMRGKLKDSILTRLTASGKFGYGEDRGSKALMEFIADNAVNRRIYGTDVVSKAFKRMGITEPSTDILGDLSMVAIESADSLVKSGVAPDLATAKNMRSSALSILRYQLGAGGPGTAAFPDLLNRLASHYMSSYGGSLKPAEARAAASSAIHDLTQGLLDTDGFDMKEAYNRLITTGTCLVPSDDFFVTAAPTEWYAETGPKRDIANMASAGIPMTLEELMEKLGEYSDSDLRNERKRNEFFKKYVGKLGLKRGVTYSDGGNLNDVQFSVDDMGSGLGLVGTEAGDFSNNRARFDAAQKALQKYLDSIRKNIRRSRTADKQIRDVTTVAVGGAKPKASVFDSP